MINRNDEFGDNGSSWPAVVSQELREPSKAPPTLEEIGAQLQSLEPQTEQHEFAAYLAGEERGGRKNAENEAVSDNLFALTAMLREGLRGYAAEEEKARVARIQRAHEVHGAFVEQTHHKENVVEPNLKHAEMAVQATDDILQRVQLERMRAERGRGRIPEFETQKESITSQKDAAVTEQRDKKGHYEQDRDAQVAAQQARSDALEAEKREYEKSKAGWQRRAKALLTEMAPVQTEEDVQRFKKEIAMLGVTRPIAKSSIQLQPGQTFESLLDAADKDNYARDPRLRVCLIAVGEHIDEIEIPAHDTRILECENQIDVCAAKVQQIKQEFAPLIQKCDDTIRSILELYEQMIATWDKKIMQERERLANESARLINQEQALDRKKGESHEVLIRADQDRLTTQQRIDFHRAELEGIRDDSRNPRHIVPTLDEALEWHQESGWRPGRLMPRLPRGADAGNEALGCTQGSAAELEAALRPQAASEHSPGDNDETAKQKQRLPLAERMQLGVRFLGITRSK